MMWGLFQLPCLLGCHLLEVNLWSSISSSILQPKSDQQLLVQMAILVLIWKPILSVTETNVSLSRQPLLTNVKLHLNNEKTKFEKAVSK